MTQRRIIVPDICQMISATVVSLADGRTFTDEEDITIVTIILPHSDANRVGELSGMVHRRISELNACRVEYVFVG